MVSLQTWLFVLMLIGDIILTLLALLIITVIVIVSIQHKEDLKYYDKRIK